MKIVRCPKCGKYIHKAVKCFHCGNTAGFEEISGSDVHENITQEYARMDILIEDKKYDEAIALSYTILEWMPNLAGVFWFRLLARYKCSTAMDQVMQMKISATINRLVDKQDSSVKAYASVTIDGMFAVHGLRVMETEKGRFVNMPSTSYTDRDGNKQYSDIFHAVTKSARNALNQAVLNAYDVKLQQIQATEIEVENTPDEEMSDEPADEPEPEMSM